MQSNVFGRAAAALPTGMLAALIVALALACTPSAVAQASLGPGRVSLPNFASLARKYGPAVVNIGVSRAPRNGTATAQASRGIRPRADIVEETTLGSGFIVSEDGYILTNAHVVADGIEISVKLTDRREFKAALIGLDAPADIALLKIDTTRLPTVRIGNPAKVAVGDWALAIGSPYGFSNSVTAGIVSAKGRVLPGVDYLSFLQTDVPVNPGNSGGPLFNLKGEVIGINSRIYSSTGGYQGLSFAIPIDIAMRIKEQLQIKGMVTRGRIGVAVQEVSEALSRSFRLPRPAGALISYVQPGGAADRAGLKPGDVLLRVAGRNVIQSADALIFIADLEPGTTARLDMWRERAPHVIEVQIEAFDAPRSTLARDGRSAQLGIVVRPLLSQERQVLGIEAGLLVQRVNAAAARAGVKAGDIILALNGQPVASVEALAEQVGEADGAVALLIQRGSTRLFIPIEADAQPPAPTGPDP